MEKVTPRILFEFLTWGGNGIKLSECLGRPQLPPSGQFYFKAVLGFSSNFPHLPSTEDRFGCKFYFL